jgi:hypothetical protein
MDRQLTGTQYERVGSGRRPPEKDLLCRHLTGVLPVLERIFRQAVVTVAVCVLTRSPCVVFWPMHGNAGGFGAVN